MSARFLDLTASVQLVTEECCNCGSIFAMSRDFYSRARADTGISFYCPAGHKQHYTSAKTVDMVEAELKREREASERLRERVENNRFIERLNREIPEFEAALASKLAAITTSPGGTV